MRIFVMLVDYNICKGTHLHLPLLFRAGIQIFVERLGETTALDVEPTDNVEQLRSTIYWEVTPSWGPGDQCLIFEDEKLKDGGTLTRHNIVHKSRIQCLFVPKAFDLGYVLYEGCRRRPVFDTIQTHRFDTVDNVKAHILEKEGISLDEHSAWLLRLGKTRLDGQLPQELQLMPVRDWHRVEVVRSRDGECQCWAPC